jgi:hypothetical protein
MSLENPGQPQGIFMKMGNSMMNIDADVDDEA